MKIIFGSALLALQILLGVIDAHAAESRTAWQVDWEKTVKAAETEGEVVVYVVDYPRFAASEFQKA